MKIKNPTSNDVRVNYKGEEYVVTAGGSAELPEDVVRHWVSIHEFMVVDETRDVEEVPVKKAVKKTTRKTTKKD